MDHNPRINMSKRASPKASPKVVYEKPKMQKESMRDKKAHKPVSSSSSEDEEVGDDKKEDD